MGTEQIYVCGRELLRMSQISGSIAGEFSFAVTATFPGRSLTTLPQIIAVVLLFSQKSELVSAVGRSVKVMKSDRAFEYFFLLRILLLKVYFNEKGVVVVTNSPNST